MRLLRGRCGHSKLGRKRWTCPVIRERSPEGESLLGGPFASYYHCVREGEKRSAPGTWKFQARYQGRAPRGVAMDQNKPLWADAFDMFAQGCEQPILVAQKLRAPAQLDEVKFQHLPVDIRQGQMGDPIQTDFVGAFVQIFAGENVGAHIGEDVVLFAPRRPDCRRGRGPSDRCRKPEIRWKEWSIYSG